MDMGMKDIYLNIIIESNYDFEIINTIVLIKELK